MSEDNRPFSESEERELRENAQWLRDQLPDEELADPELLKLQIRIRLQEDWLAGELQDESEPDLTALRARVQEELSQTPESTWSQRPRWWAGIGLGAAALIGWMFIPSVLENVPEENVAEWIAGTSTDDDILLSLVDLEFEIAQLETGGASWIRSDDVISDTLMDLESFFQGLDS